MKQLKVHRASVPDGTLVIVDMQPGYTFGCKNPRLMASVLAEVRDAKARGWGIVALEVKPWKFGETDESIMHELGGYKRFVVQRKSDDDGSEEVIKACIENGYSLLNFRVVGVYIDACVVDTAVSLVEKLAEAQVRVVKRACSTNFDEVGAWQAFRRRMRLKVA